ncbi:tonB-system energizer ExbB [Nitrosococcus wardiae]|uniref:Biopolymer transport protein ExbB n=1 Tax=Nitrosococcus wardiae TaxID=1814290 RepID=A0A4V1AW32_9GAMM|nr:tonB-system energizer ExbB [Nitrosococcus wardiae]QBQ55225.1 tonB-system energizer ExbB [Nitrosococcus wardiae]
MKAVTLNVTRLLSRRRMFRFCWPYALWTILIVFWIQSAAWGQTEALAEASPSLEQTASVTSAKARVVDPATLPHDLSPWGMFLSADWVVKAVIIGLVFASIVTWTIGLAKSLELGMGKRRLRGTLAELGEARTLGEGMESLHHREGIVSLLADVVEKELDFFADSIPEKEGIKERIAAGLGRIEVAASRRISRGTGILATIGSTAPFVGLFGTVWGIMNSFIGISEAQTTNLAVVAPGIAEALLVTAIGLIAAIPAVVIYNLFARSTAGYRALLGDISSEVLQLVSRDLDQRQLASSAPEQRQPLLRNVME